MGLVYGIALALAVALFIYLIIRQKQNNKQLSDQYQILEKKRLPF